MTAFEIAITARRCGVTFGYEDSVIVAEGAERLPPDLQAQLQERFGDVCAVIAEHSVPVDYTASDVADQARRLLLAERRRTAAGKR